MSLLQLSRFFSSGINNRQVRPLRPPRSLLRFSWSHPRLYRVYGQVCHKIDIFDSSSYDFAFDGFPRSGNTFGSRMLAATQDNKIKVLSNAHCPPFLLAALQLDKPVCLTIRRPEDAVVSWYLFKKKMSMEEVLRLYIDFHSVMLPYRSRVLVVPFSVITQDFGIVLRLINRRFHCELAVPQDIGSYQQTVFARIDRYYEGRPGGYDILQVARPHQERDELKPFAHEKLRSPQYRRLLAECQRLYEIFAQEYQSEAAVSAPRRVQATSQSRNAQSQALAIPSPATLH